MPKKRRIAVAINAQHPHTEDQQLYHGIRRYSQDHPGSEYVLAPFITEDLIAASPSKPPYDGIIAQATPELEVAAARLKIPVVDVWRDSLLLGTVPCVCPDFEKAGRMVGEHLVSRGFENFGVVVTQSSLEQNAICGVKCYAEIPSFSVTVKEHGFKCSLFSAPRNVVYNAQVWQRWCRDIRKWLIAQPKPLALFVPQDFLCRYIADLASDLGLNVPHDLGLICAENEPNLCKLTNPTLSSIDLGYSQVGYESAVLLEEIMAGRHRVKIDEFFRIDSCVLHPRSSTDAVVVNDPLAAQAMRFILENSTKSIKVGDVAAAVSATRRTLDRRFHDFIGRTVKQEIVRCRLEHVKRRLVESDDLLKELALNSGFSSKRRLYETFVREEGIAPSAYRAKRQPAAVLRDNERRRTPSVSAPQGAYAST